MKPNQLPLADHVTFDRREQLSLVEVYHVDLAEIAPCLGDLRK